MADLDLETRRHGAAHLMAAAVRKLYPDAKLDIGPATADGFYYDFDLEHRFVPEDLAAIEEAIKELIRQKLAADDQWSLVIDMLNTQLREHPDPDAPPRAQPPQC